MAKKKSSESIKVVVRIRPLSSKEIQDERKVIAFAHEERGAIEVHNLSSLGSDNTKHFSFDAVFSEKSSQRKIYDTCAAPIVNSVLNGYNGTVFVYGQTGAGKTHTMEGVPEDPELRGIIPNAFQHVFDHVALKGSNETYLVRASYFEIYNEEIRDLLSPNPKAGLELKESTDTGVYVKDLSSHIVKSFTEIDRVMQMGKIHRSVGATLMNAGSSRSHSVFSIVIECCVKDDEGKNHIRVGKLNLVDLAGSERQGKTGATGERLKEATKINLSLSALGNVISALVDGKTQHIPYRDSKLTRILQDSLGGNTKTVMCANAGPAEYNYDEIVSTLRYANRAKRIKNIPVINEDPKDAMLREYQEEIAKLRAQVERIDIVYHPNEESAQSKSSSMTTLLRDVALQDFKEHAAKERADLMAQSEEERANIQTERKHSKEEKRALEEKLEIESRTREEIDMQRLNLQKKLQDMEAQLIIGGDLTNEAAKQEAELRKAQQDLIAKQEAEIASSRQMMEKEEANLNLTEQYSSLQEACQSITKKLKKLWKKYQQAKAEIEDLNKEFQIERTDMLGTIRDLNKHTMRKDMIIDNFIPPEHVTKFNDESQGGLASWDESEEKWIIARLDLAGNNFVKAIPTSVVGAFRPETDYSRCRQQLGGDRRHCHENILSLDLDYVSKATENSIDNTADANIIKKRIDDDSDSSHTNKGKTPYLWFTKEKKQGKVKRDHGVHRPRTAYH